MKLDNVLKQLRANGYCSDSALLWSSEDVEMSLDSLSIPTRDISNTDKQIILDNFFDHHGDHISEYIGDLLRYYIENEVTNLNPSQIPF